MDTTEPMMSELRRCTRESHSALEEQIAIEQALGSIESYGDLLQRFLAIYQVLEPQVLSTPDLDRWVTDLPQRRRVPDLLTDLKALDRPQYSQLSATAAPATDVPDALGCLYVLEGSTLGGQLIAQQVTERLGLTPEHGCQFFAGAGRNTRALWNSFAQSLESFAAAHPECRRQIAQSALTTFARVDSSFASWPGENLLVHHTSVFEGV